MPTITLVPGADGYWKQYASITGAASAWEALDETPHDGDTSYITLTPTEELVMPLASFHFHGASNLRPKSVTLQHTSKQTVGTVLVALELSDKDGNIAFGEEFSGTADYTQRTKAFTTHPYTGAPFAAGDLNGLEIVLRCRKHTLGSYPCEARFTRAAVVVVYDEPTMYRTRRYGNITG